MALIDAVTIKKIAHLSRIRITDAEIEPLQHKLDSIMKMISELQTVNTDGVEPMVQTEGKMVQRADEVADGGYANDLLKNAPEAAHGFFVVPKVVE